MHFGGFFEDDEQASIATWSRGGRAAPSITHGAKALSRGVCQLCGWAEPLAMNLK